MEQEAQEFDCFVIGGGSGGLAAAKAASGHGVTVGVCDYVKPSTQGTKWGLGGTCVNVGCIPKKLMHFASMMGEFRADQEACGWKVDPNSQHSWEDMVAKVQKHIKSINWGSKTGLIERGINYFNMLGSFQDKETLKLHNPVKNKTQYVKAKKYIIATGGRPIIPDDVPGAKEHCITSDDIFSLKTNPGKTLVVGASYVALECAGFLTGIGNDTTVLVRSILLRGFDQDMAEKVGKYMEEHGTKFLYKCVLSTIEKQEDGKKKVTWKNTETGETFSNTFDTILLAIGRQADLSGLELEKAGVEINPKSKKVIVDETEATSNPNVFAIGDIAHGKLELTPTAILAGRLLANRLFGNAKQLMSYKNVATTVFTPLEYGAVGYAEEEAEKEFGKDNIIVYHRFFKPLEWNFLDSHKDDSCYVKVICDKTKDEKILGMHYLGPNAGEVIQGYAVSVKLGITKAQFDETVGIHPTSSEEFMQIIAVKGIDDGLKKDGC
eukprot:CAMPEP_0114582708 /NCGR_PEP_ID=MMETSP0125-20121206/6619_1 /TAXON_ID=485358 ORGANISM="Aristerostoma sp., Strain ATCC 50986" /NCGR_SAMPLE_ID=MMETSP0125 /ASSEMBLY_ACC=CAM_ASM_000245 /LENGTH=492 /DNA_ID=CAMNT_0001775791 /DNA_START=39 /DNA_END=1517 /DNA_ORIENTATION=-